MGVYSDYLDKGLDFESVTKERKRLLSEISKLRGGRDILVYAADINYGRAPISIDYSDLLPISDQLENLSGNKVDLLIETPGGSGEVAEDIVNQIRKKYSSFGVIVPGYAKSAGTIIAMAADEILMDDMSSLGPIDAQLSQNGKVFSAEALLEGLNKIKEEVNETGVLSKAYIPILQQISPGELQRAQNSLDFAKVLVTRWLANYKFKDWDVHSSTGEVVTQKDKLDRATEIANVLGNHSEWLTHGRSIKKDDLISMKLRITDYSGTDLQKAIHKYYALMQISFQSNLYKIIETSDSQIYRFMTPQHSVIPQQNAQNAKRAVMELTCSNCKSVFKIQCSFEEGVTLEEDVYEFPKNNVFKCPNCGIEHDVSEYRRNIEAQAKRKIL